MKLTIRTDNDFSSEIVSLCKKHGIDKVTLARETELSYKTISRIFENENPRKPKEPYNITTRNFHKILKYIRDNYDEGIIIIEME